MKRRQKLCSRALRHLQRAHEKLMALRAQGMELPPSKQYQFLEDHPELSGLPRELPDGTRPVNYLWLPSHDAVATDEALAPLSLRAEPLHALAEAMCRGKALGLKVASKRGDALFMDVMDTEGREVKADWRLWHAGCSPLEPDQRLTAQIFLETDTTNSSNLACCDSKGGTCAESCRSHKMTN